MAKRESTSREVASAAPRRTNFLSDPRGLFGALALVGAGVILALALGRFAGHRMGERGAGPDEMGRLGQSTPLMMGGAPNGGNRGMQGGGFMSPLVSGTVTAVSDTSVTMTLADGTSATYTLDSSTRILAEGGAPSTTITVGAKLSAKVSPADGKLLLGVLILK